MVFDNYKDKTTSALFRVESPGSSIVVGIVEAKKYF